MNFFDELVAYIEGRSGLDVKITKEAFYNMGVFHCELLVDGYPVAVATSPRDNGTVFAWVNATLCVRGRRRDANLASLMYPAVIAAVDFQREVARQNVARQDAANKRVEMKKTLCEAGIDKVALLMCGDCVKVFVNGPKISVPNDTDNEGVQKLVKLIRDFEGGVAAWTAEYAQNKGDSEAIARR